MNRFISAAILAVFAFTASFTAHAEEVEAVLRTNLYGTWEFNQNITLETDMYACKEGNPSCSYYAVFVNNKILPRREARELLDRAPSTTHCVMEIGATKEVMKKYGLTAQTPMIFRSGTQVKYDMHQYIVMPEPRRVCQTRQVDNCEQWHIDTYGNCPEDRYTWEEYDCQTIQDPGKTYETTRVSLPEPSKKDFSLRQFTCKYRGHTGNLIDGLRPEYKGDYLLPNQIGEWLHYVQDAVVDPIVIGTRP